MNIEREDIKIIVAVLLFLGVGIFLFIRYFYIPTTKEIASLKIELANRESVLKRDEEAVATLEITKIRYRLLEEELSYVEVILPKTKDMPGLIKTITTIGEDAFINFKTFIPKPLSSQPYYDEYPIDLSVSSTYHNLGVFLSKVGGVERIIVPSSVNIAGIEGKENLLSINLNLKTFIYKESAGGQ